TQWLKVVTRRKRPVLYTSGAAAAAADRESQQSLPSGHASLAFAAATSYLVLARRQHLPHRTRNAILLYAGAVGVSALRVAAGKHFPTDVAAGAALGSGLGWRSATGNRARPLPRGAGRDGPASLVLWVIAMVIFFLPSAMAVRELADIDPGEGGIYRWATRAFGPRHGFLAGWGYWVNNLVYYPSLLLTSGAIVAYVGGPGFVHLAENKWFIAAFSLGNLWIAVGLNLVGLRVGRWVQNLGAYG